jgi:hypothetical protein
LACERLTMQNILIKRTADNRLFDVDCTALLDSAETIMAILNVSADGGGLTFSSPVINGIPLVYPNGTTAAVGKVIQVYISGGTIPAGQPWVDYTVRAQFSTSLNPVIEATVILQVNDTPDACGC